MSFTSILSFEHAKSLASSALQSNGTAIEVADCVAHALALADADDLRSHGLERIPSYVGQLRSGKVDGHAKPSCRRVKPSSIEIMANDGFAFPAIELAIGSLVDVCEEQGVAAAAIVGSHHCGVMGHAVEKLARAGFACVMFANTPKAMAVAGGGRPVLGTNPIAFACPRATEHAPLVIDTSLSVVARGKVALAAKKGERVPAGWGVNSHGEPTTDPLEILEGGLNPVGGAKGSALALMVEILAGAFVRSNFGFQASSFFDGEGGPPRVGQLLISLNASEFNSHFADHVEQLLSKIESEPNARIPGARRQSSRISAFREGLEYSQDLIDSIKQLSGI
ncbi:MAG: Ldh family oxidoreductase [Acidiferrobacterales bacterium]|nr:Ldh family oxidoreductase [Acidiferrobacterales bacterium]